MRINSFIPSLPGVLGWSLFVGNPGTVGLRISSEWNRTNALQVYHLLPVPTHAVLVNLGVVGGLQCHLGLKRSSTSEPPRPHHLEPWTASLELHYSGAAPISLAPNHSWSTEWRRLTKAHFREDYKPNRKAFEWEFVWNVIKTMIIPPDQQNYL